jgi:hypothetical protein
MDCQPQMADAHNLENKQIVEFLNLQTLKPIWSNQFMLNAFKCRLRNYTMKTQVVYILLGIEQIWKLYDKVCHKIIHTMLVQIWHV